MDIVEQSQAAYTAEQARSVPHSITLEGMLIRVKPRVIKWDNKSFTKYECTVLVTNAAAVGAAAATNGHGVVDAVPGGLRFVRSGYQKKKDADYDFLVTGLAAYAREHPSVAWAGGVEKMVAGWTRTVGAKKDIQQFYVNLGLEPFRTSAMFELRNGAMLKIECDEPVTARVGDMVNAEKLVVNFFAGNTSPDPEQRYHHVLVNEATGREMRIRFAAVCLTPQTNSINALPFDMRLERSFNYAQQIWYPRNTPALPGLYPRCWLFAAEVGPEKRAIGKYGEAPGYGCLISANVAFDAETAASGTPFQRRYGDDGTQNKITFSAYPVKFKVTNFHYVRADDDATQSALAPFYDHAEPTALPNGLVAFVKNVTVSATLWARNCHASGILDHGKWVEANAVDPIPFSALFQHEKDKMDEKDEKKKDGAPGATASASAVAAGGGDDDDDGRPTDLDAPDGSVDADAGVAGDANNVAMSVHTVGWHMHAYVAKHGVPVSLAFAHQLLGGKATIPKFEFQYREWDKTTSKWNLQNTKNHGNETQRAFLVNASEYTEDNGRMAPFLDPRNKWQARVMILANRDDMRNNKKLFAAWPDESAKLHAATTAEEGDRVVGDFVKQYLRLDSLGEFAHHTRDVHCLVWFWRPLAAIVALQSLLEPVVHSPVTLAETAAGDSPSNHGTKRKRDEADEDLPATQLMDDADVDSDDADAALPGKKSRLE